VDGRKTITLAGLTGLVGALVAACGHAPRGPAAHAADADETITLFHDGARVRQPITIKAPGTKTQRISMVVPAGVDPADVKLVDLGDLEASLVEGTMDEDAPSQVAFDVVAKKPGTYHAHVEYVMPMWWSATYTMTTTPARQAVTVRGAIGLLNKTGTPIAKVHLLLFDAGLTDPPLEDCSVKPCKKLPPLDLGMRDIPAGDSRIELLENEPPRPMHTVLVYDPIGTRLDDETPATNTDPELGLHIPISSHVSDGYEIMRPSSQPEGLPKGTGRLFERGADGQLRLLGETDVFGPLTRVAKADTIAMGSVDDVLGTRERHDFSNDVDSGRTTEEFWITLTSKRATPVDVVVREHMYRGLNWGIGYQSVPDFQKEGAQQLAARVKLPAHGQTRIVYVVVYTEPP
jgi:hypothetical protein